MSHGDSERTFGLDEAVEILRRTPATLRALLDGLPDAWLDCDEGAGTWSARIVVGHLIHGERSDWIPRARLILDKGERATFEPFDRFAQLRERCARPIAQLLETFAELRADNLDTLAGLRLTPADLERRGRHPDFGPVTLEQLLATWVAHDLGHVAQIARVMAKRYGADVGPWKAFLPILAPRS